MTPTTNDLMTYSTLADLQLQNESVTPNTLISEVGVYFKCRPEVVGLLVQDDKEFYGLLSRNSYFEHMSQVLSGSVFSRRPVSKLLSRINCTALELNDTSPIVDAVRELFNRPPSELYEPLLIKCENGEYRFLDVARLVHFQCQILLEQKTIAEIANHEKSHFLANMSHEIRTPLNGIMGFTDVLRRGVGSKAEQQEYLDVIYKNGEHLLGLINDILDLSKIEAGRMEYEKRNYSPHKIISEALSTMRVQAKEKGLSLECQWTSSVPETIHTDPMRLKQILINLVGNAIKFTKQGSVKLTATLDRSQANPQFVVEVHDTGIGIDPQNLKNIFSPFTQADSSITRSFGGTGLGLTICRQIADGLGGDLTVESEVGKGSTFRLWVDAGALENVRIFKTPPTEAFMTNEQFQAETAESSCLRGIQILLVDDGKTNRDLISLVLENAHASVTCAENGEEALQEYDRGEFDLILMDMQMPLMDGYTATSTLRSRGCSLPIIALTANAMRGDRDKCLAAGCSDFLTKPINIESLLQTVVLNLPEVRPSAKTQLKQKPSCVTSEDISPIVSDLPTEIPKILVIVEDFIQRLTVKLDEMRNALKASDWSRLEDLAHWLKGTGGTAGFSCLTESALQLELSAKRKEKETATAILEELARLGQRLTAKKTETGDLQNI
ncbi:Autoinducer 2 sensor kinase/phosphatase LuxQ [Gimesia alba]|uniref:histidine kinase n=1 Tax=Gimesia alba TaxID=2527973 RepID=A0A517RLC8_9PLAN|nr:ATP-binding protein [Gimesia alba]QDT44696.1 Autoinducer 2 sensor kinase/phosphatase LuxQ [Gimesia alba]